MEMLPAEIPQDQQLQAPARFGSIALVAPCEPQTVDLVARLATWSGAAVTCLAVIPEPPSVWLEYQSALAEPIDLRALLEQEWQRRLETVADPLRQAGVPTTTRVLTGAPFLEITREVLREDHRLVVIQAEDDAESGARAIGAAATHLIRKCPCAVWVVRSGQASHGLRLLAAVDPDSVDPDGEVLNGLILGLARALQTSVASEIHVVHVWRLAGEKMFQGSARLSEGQVRSLREHERDRHRRALHGLLERHGLLRVRTHFVSGEAAVQIAATAQRIGADVVVMGTVSRTGVAGFLIGNTAERVVSSLDCSVLAVKPPGFRSPVSLDA